MNLKDELIRIQARRKETPAKVMALAENATYAAIDAAAAATPPTENDLRGVKTRTGALKDHWATDSITKAERVNGGYETHLKNSQPYASFVNDGHRMDKHFVPGLYVNPYSGQLEYSEAMRGEVGIMVGTKTKYVPGLFMAEKGEEAFAGYVDEHGAEVLEAITE